MKKDIKKDINLASALLAELYQLLGRLDYDFAQYKNEIIPSMDVIIDCLNRLDPYFDDKLFDRSHKSIIKSIRQNTNEKSKKT